MSPNQVWEDEHFLLQTGNLVDGTGAWNILRHSKNLLEARASTVRGVRASVARPLPETLFATNTPAYQPQVTGVLKCFTVSGC